MALLKKISSDWTPQEKLDLQVGEVFDFPGPFEALVRNGMAILVDGDGNELEMPGQMFECPVCFEKIEGLINFNKHISSHAPKVKEKAAVVEVEVAEVKPAEKSEEVKAEAPAKVEAPKAVEDDVRAKRLAALEKARAARVAKK